MPPFPWTVTSKNNTLTTTSRKLFPLTFLRTTLHLLSHLSERTRKKKKPVSPPKPSTNYVLNWSYTEWLRYSELGFGRFPPGTDEAHGDAGPVRISKCELKQDKRVWSRVPPCPAVIVEVCGRSCWMEIRERLSSAVYRGKGQITGDLSRNSLLCANLLLFKLRSNSLSSALHLLVGHFSGNTYLLPCELWQAIWETWWEFTCTYTFHLYKM